MNKSLEEKERMLTDWWIRNADPTMGIIDSIDIGWAGAAAWASSLVELGPGALHIDIACGWGSFIVQIRWRSPGASVVGLNIDFEGSHSSINELFRQAGVEGRCSLVQADARFMPFRAESFDSASCFLGLQDIQIGFGNEGIRDTVQNALRIVKTGGSIFFIDTRDVITTASPHLKTGSEVFLQDVFVPKVQWTREIAETATRMYAQGYVEQMRIRGESRKHEEYEKVLAHMRAEMEEQFQEKGHFNPLKAIHIIGIEKQ